MAEELYDVAIIGGGPAGSTAATLLARAGRRVIVLERDKFPRFKIGESLLPFSMKAFTRLGLQEKFRRAGFMEKYGGEMVGACSEEGVKFYFKDGFGSQTDRAYQVTRAEFDKVLLDHARENGVEVHEETAVESVDFSDDGSAAARQAEGRRRCRELRARYLIDASGRNSVVGSKFKLKKNYEHLQKVSIFAHYDGVTRDPGIDGTLTRLVRAHRPLVLDDPAERRTDEHRRGARFRGLQAGEAIARRVSRAIARRPAGDQSTACMPRRA